MLDFSFFFTLSSFEMGILVFKWCFMLFYFKIKLEKC